MNRLLGIIARLRAPGGCPWDRMQTHRSLKPYLLEETYELLEALDEKDDAHLIEEMGDVLLQLVLHAQLKSEKKRFTFHDVVKRLEEKMIFRHPHVFKKKSKKLQDMNALNAQWDALKVVEKQSVGKKTKRGASSPSPLFENIPKGLPALMKAQKIQSRAAKQGFDWPDERGPLKKIREELRELEAELSKKHRSKPRITAELGDILFSVVNLARKLDMTAEEALRASNRTFEKRVSHVLSQFPQKLPSDPRRLEKAWRKAKSRA